MFNNCILNNVKKVEKNLSQIANEEFEAVNIHYTYGYIMTIIASKEYVKTKDIAKELCLESSTVTRMVSKLENDGLVEKGSPNSSVDICLTHKGHNLIPKINKAWDNFHQRCNTILTEETKTDLNTTLQEINKCF